MNEYGMQHLCETVEQRWNLYAWIGIPEREWFETTILAETPALASIKISTNHLNRVTIIELCEVVRDKCTTMVKQTSGWIAVTEAQYTPSNEDTPAMSRQQSVVFEEC